MYHVSNNLYFHREEDGSVRIIKFRSNMVVPPFTTEDNEVWERRIKGLPEMDVTVSAHEWASIVTDVAAEGVCGYTYQQALKLHMEKQGKL